MFDGIGISGSHNHATHANGFGYRLPLRQQPRFVDIGITDGRRCFAQRQDLLASRPGSGKVDSNSSASVFWTQRQLDGTVVARNRNGVVGAFVLKAANGCTRGFIDHTVAQFEVAGGTEGDGVVGRIDRTDVCCGYRRGEGTGRSKHRG